MIPILGLIVAGWLLLPAKTFSNCMQPALKLPDTLVAVTIVTLLLGVAAFIVGRSSRAAGVTLSVVLLVLALGSYSIGGWFISDNYFPEYVISRAACGRTAADVAKWAWPIAIPLLVVALSAASALMRRPWGEIVAAVIALGLCAVLVVSLL